jgi:hypothetical protein
MRKSIKFSLLTSIRCLFSCYCVVAMTAAVLTPSARAATNDGSTKVAKKKFCVIIRPASHGEMPVESRPHLQNDRPSSDKVGYPLVSFFKGQVKKIGFGAPKSFSIKQMIPSSLTGSALSGSKAANMGIQEENGRDVNCFFPSVGYYSRFSQNGTQAVAVGVGLRGPDPADSEMELPTTPEASVAVMVGFAF